MNSDLSKALNFFQRGRLVEAKNLVEEIVKNEFESEIEAYNMSGNELIDELFSGQGISSINDPKGEFYFLEEAKTALEFIGLIVATYEVCKKFVSTMKSNSSDKELEVKLRTEWEASLIEAGIRKHKAVIISSNFSKRAIEIFGKEVKK